MDGCALQPAARLAFATYRGLATSDRLEA